MTELNTKVIKLVTHNGSFHADDIFAAATLSMYLENNGKNFDITRTRDEELINQGDYVFDVGGVYDQTKNRFDHHQKGGAGRRENGIEYASFGLVWKKFGPEICKEPKAVEIIDIKLASPIDGGDNGMDLFENKSDVSPYLIQNFFGAMYPTWREEDRNTDEIFLKCVEIAKVILSREIIQAQDRVVAEDVVISAYEGASDKRIIILDENYPTYILSNFHEPCFIIYPRKTTKDWGTKAVRMDLKTFKNKKDFPKTWGGLRDEELQHISGVPDAVFCHRALFLAVAKSKEGAIKLAQIALEPTEQ